MNGIAGFPHEDLGLWKDSFGNDSFEEKARNRLKAALFSFREKSAVLASEIAHDMPEYTVHDITHCDGLWKIAQIVAGNDIKLNPVEAFILGSAFLIHDLGMAMAAYDSKDEIEGMKEYKAACIGLSRNKYGTANDETDPVIDDEIKKEATKLTIRRLHAKKAQVLIKKEWTLPGKPTVRLLEDSEILDQLGDVVGRISASHAWGIDRIEKEFEFPSGAPSFCPSDWTIDPLKLACLLRVADATHITADRAPLLLMSLRNPKGISKRHWNFQAKLATPCPHNKDQLLYASNTPFTTDEITDWMECYDMAKMINSELRAVDNLLAQNNKPRFAARSVAGVENMERFAHHVKVSGWHPVETQIRVGDVSGLVKNLGGEALYGPNLLAPLRELIQNGIDAIRARRILDDMVEDWGDVHITTGNEGDFWWIEVKDNGIGMSREVLLGPFLDFGTSFWNSDFARDLFPDLLIKGYRSVGKYGIGFYSVFMWGDRVQVITCPYNKGRETTQVLEFKEGLGGRPILRPANDDEKLPEGGTAVKVWFRQQGWFGGRIFPSQDKFDEDCTELCMAIDADLYLHHDGRKKAIIKCNDWKTLTADEILKRLGGEETLKYFSENHEMLVSLFRSNIRDIYSLKNKSLIGRAAIIGGDFTSTTPDNKFLSAKGRITVGGFSTSGLGFPGLLVGKALTAARNQGVAFAKEELKEWASEQAKLLSDKNLPVWVLRQCAIQVRSCGGDTGPLPIAYAAGKWSTKDELSSFFKNNTKAHLVEPHYEKNSFHYIGFDPDQLDESYKNGPYVFFSFDSHGMINPHQAENAVELEKRGIGSLIVEIAANAWNCDYKDLIDSLSDQIKSKKPPFDNPRQTSPLELGVLDGKNRITHRYFILEKP